MPISRTSKIINGDVTAANTRFTALTVAPKTGSAYYLNGASIDFQSRVNTGNGMNTVARISSWLDGGGDAGLNNHSGGLAFGTKADSGSAVTDKMYLTHAGYLGVGTLTPQVHLEVAGNISANVGAGNPYVMIRTAGAGNNPYIRMQGGSTYWDIQSTFSNSNDELMFMANGTTKMQLTNSGTLSLSGDIRLSSTVSATIDMNGKSGSTWYTLIAPGNLSIGYWQCFYRWDYGGSGGPYIVGGCFQFCVVNTNGSGRSGSFTPMTTTHTGATDTIIFATKAGASSTTGLDFQTSGWTGNGNLAAYFVKLSD